MNGRKARRLRAEAFSLTVGQKKTRYVLGRPPQFVSVTSVNGTPTGEVRKVVNGVPTKLGTCTRKTYKQLKREAS